MWRLAGLFSYHASHSLVAKLSHIQTTKQYTATATTTTISVISFNQLLRFQLFYLLYFCSDKNCKPHIPAIGISILWIFIVSAAHALLMQCTSNITYDVVWVWLKQNKKTNKRNVKWLNGWLTNSISIYVLINFNVK